MNLLLDILFCYLVVWITFMPVMFVVFMIHQIRYLFAYYNGKPELNVLTIICMIINCIGPTLMWPIFVAKNLVLDGEF